MYYRLTQEQVDKFKRAYEYESHLPRKELEGDAVIKKMKASWSKRDCIAYQKFVKEHMTQGQAMIFSKVTENAVSVVEAVEADNAGEKVSKSGCCIVM
tara:strand:- start:84516 stop:84809 length:294 start_codon:yes stop_codon:yes gene_type:complete